MFRIHWMSIANYSRGKGNVSLPRDIADAWVKYLNEEYSEYVHYAVLYPKNKEDKQDKQPNSDA